MTTAQRNQHGRPLSVRATTCRLMVGALCWLLTLSAAAAADDALDDYRLAVGFYNKEQWKLAAEGFQSFLKKHAGHPKSENARYFQALSLIKLEEFRTARDLLRGVARDYPEGRNLAGTLYWTAHCSLALDDYDSARREFLNFLETAPDDPLRQWALPYLGESELRLNHPQEALTRFDEALAAFPEGPLTEDARFGRARSLELLKRTDDAVAAYREVASDRRGARAAEAQLNLGALAFDAGRFADAAAAYATLEERFPASPQAPLAQLNHGFALYQLGRYPEAIAQFDKAAHTDQHAAEAALWKGLALLKSPDGAAAASAVLEAAYDKHRDQPIAEKLLFHRAECALRLGEFGRAREIYLSVVARFPQGALAAEALHAACQAAVSGDDLAAAEPLLTRFDREFPGNRLRLRQEILKGRVLAARNDLDGAAAALGRVIAATEIESTADQARYYLADVLQRGQRYQEALEVSAPLAARWDAGTGPAELAGVFVVRGVCHLALARASAKAPAERGGPALSGSARDAIAAAARYIELDSQGSLAAQALGVQAVAWALGGDKTKAAAALAELRKAPDPKNLDQTLYDVGAIAYAREDWVWAEQVFAELASRPRDSAWHARALADLGWTRNKRGQHLEAAATFERLLAEHPSDPLAPEAAFMRGSALQDAGRADEAQAAFAAAFRREEPSEHVFLAGLQVARLLARGKRFDEADAAYAAVLQRFPERPDGDKILDEWASAHYSAENFAAADRLFARLAAERPDSPLADNARLSLAESELIAGRLDDARRALRALKEDSRSDPTVQQRALFQLMQIELEHKQWDDLRKVCDESLARFPDGTYRLDAQWRRAEADFQSADYPAAEERLTRLIAAREDPELRAAPWLPQVWVLLAETQLQRKEHEAVAATVEALRTFDPRSPLQYQADEVLGRSLKAQSRWAEARAVFERVVQDPHGRLTETAAKSQFFLAETHLFEKNYEAALKEYLTVEIRYKFPEWQAPALFQAGVCQEALKQWKAAAKTYDDLVRNYPENADVTPKARERLQQVRKNLAAAG